MYRNIDVKTELRRLTDSKPVHAVAGAGVLASQALKDMPGRLVRWSTANPVASLPARASGYMQAARSNAAGYVHKARSDAPGYVHAARSNATGYVRTARSRAAGSYDALAARGRKALTGQVHATPGTGHATPSKGNGSTQGKTAANGKAKGKAPSRSNSASD